MLAFFKVHYLPGLTLVWLLATCLLTYAISTLGGHVYIFFPMISDSGTRPPESCIFGELLYLLSILMMAVMYLRYRQVQLAMDFGYIHLNKKWNQAALFFGIVASLGGTVLASFQETSVLSVHVIGACAAIIAGWYYLIVQTRISYEYMHLGTEYPQYAISRAMFYFRLFIACILLPLLIVESIFAIIMYLSFTGKSVEWYTEEDGNFQARLIASFTEWIIVILLFVYPATFTNEFKTVECNGFSVELRGAVTSKL